MVIQSFFLFFVLFFLLWLENILKVFNVFRPDEKNSMRSRDQRSNYRHELLFKCIRMYSIRRISITYYERLNETEIIIDIFMIFFGCRRFRFT